MNYSKLKTLEEIKVIRFQAKKEKKCVIHCHGVFDLVHPGHIKHFKEAKSLGDILIVSLTADSYVNKAPGRPYFNQNLRAETLEAIKFIDFVYINHDSDAVKLIEELQPDVYVKGKEYLHAENDVTNKISLEIEAVKNHQGKIHYTDDVVFSSSQLINTYFDPPPQPVKLFFDRIKQSFTLQDTLSFLNSLENLKVLVIGDAIIDEYQYVEPLGQSGKGVHMVAKCHEKEIFAGGCFAVANHASYYTDNVTLLTAVGKNDPHIAVIEEKLNTNIQRRFVYIDGEQTLVKKRYILKDGKTLSKLFETYNGNDLPLAEQYSKKICEIIKKTAGDFDLVLVCDYGNGFTNKEIIHHICQYSPFLALNTQINSGNKGFNVITRYSKADYISLNEIELRRSTHSRYGNITELAHRIKNELLAQYISVTRGVNGVMIFGQDQKAVEIPAFTMNSVDRIGAGDSYLALSSLCIAKKFPVEISGLIGAAAAALDIQIVGNKDFIDKVSLSKYLTTLFK